jgi:hypothetical protein
VVRLAALGTPYSSYWAQPGCGNTQCAASDEVASFPFELGVAMRHDEVVTTSTKKEQGSVD